VPRIVTQFSEDSFLRRFCDFLLQIREFRKQTELARRMRARTDSA
jgi:hypothetical protein